MARRTTTITIEEEGRDKGKVFVLTEMPATAAEAWATQALYLLTQAGVVVDAEAQAAGGMAALAATGSGVESIAQIRALQDPSLDAWWDCVRYLHAPNLPPQPINRGAACQIEEMKTISFLRVEVLKLHTDFFSPASPSTTALPSSAVPTGSSPTRISRPRSVP